MQLYLSSSFSRGSSSIFFCFAFLLNYSLLFLKFERGGCNPRKLPTPQDPQICWVHINFSYSTFCMVHWGMGYFNFKGAQLEIPTKVQGPYVHIIKLRFTRNIVYILK